MYPSFIGMLLVLVGASVALPVRKENSTAVSFDTRTVAKSTEAFIDIRIMQYRDQANKYTTCDCSAAISEWKKSTRQILVSHTNYRKRQIQFDLDKTVSPLLYSSHGCDSFLHDILEFVAEYFGHPLLRPGMAMCRAGCSTNGHTIHGLWPQWAQDCTGPAFDSNEVCFVG